MTCAFRCDLGIALRVVLFRASWPSPCDSIVVPSRAMGSILTANLKSKIIEDMITAAVAAHKVIHELDGGSEYPMSEKVVPLLAPVLTGSNACRPKVRTNGWQICWTGRPTLANSLPTGLFFARQLTVNAGRTAG